MPSFFPAHLYLTSTCPIASYLVLCLPHCPFFILSFTSCPTALKVTSDPNPVQDIVQTIQCNPLLPALPTSYLSLSTSPCPNLMLENPSFFFSFEGAIPFDRNTSDLLFPSCRTPTHPSSLGLSHPFLWETQAEWSLCLPGSWSSCVSPVTLPWACDMSVSSSEL